MHSTKKTFKGLTLNLHQSSLPKKLKIKLRDGKNTRSFTVQSKKTFPRP
jgi:hypothetical protein